MIRDIMKDPLFLAKKSTDAGPADMQTAMDLVQTLAAHRDGCVGMAANMIGVSKRIIIFAEEETGMTRLMFNPKITAKEGPYQAEEGCLSLPGVRRTTRYETITVEFQDASFKKQKEVFHGYTAQIIQHEIDMTNGILI